MLSNNKNTQMMKLLINYSKNEVNSMTGKSGSILMIDTCNCLHMGSREKRKNRDQL